MKPEQRLQEAVANARARHATMTSVLASDVQTLLSEVAILRQAATSIVELTPDNCRHNREIDPDTGECADCGTVLP